MILKASNLKHVALISAVSLLLGFAAGNFLTYAAGSAAEKQVIWINP